MNILDGYVTKVLEEPFFNDTYPDLQWWQVKVEYDCYGWLSETNLTFKTKEEMDEVKVGYKFLC